MSVEGSQPPQTFYDAQTLGPGFNYITTRDGTTLSAYVTLPGAHREGPLPDGGRLLRLLAVEAGRARSATTTCLCDALPVLCDAPNDPARAHRRASSATPRSSVNMRGTGCSGGAYDYFETLQLLDGYDVIETVAAQPWVAAPQGRHGRPLVSRHHAAVRRATQPPRLAAITPLSVIGSAHTTDAAGRHPQRRLRARVGRRSVLDEAAAVRPGLGAGARRRRRHAVRREPAPARPARRQRGAGAHDARSTIRRMHDPLNPSDVRRQDRRAGVPRAARGRTSRPGRYFFTAARSVHRRRRRRASPSTTACTPTASRPQVLAEWNAFLESVRRAARCPIDRSAGRAICRRSSSRASSSSLHAAPRPQWSRATPTYERGDGRLEGASRRCAPSSRAAPARPTTRRARRHASRRSFAELAAARRRSRARFYFQPDGTLDADAADRRRARRRRSSSIPTPASAASSRPAATSGTLPALRLAPARRRQGGGLRVGAARRATR